jgi:hypothetical protein
MCNSFSGNSYTDAQGSLKGTDSCRQAPSGCDACGPPFETEKELHTNKSIANKTFFFQNKNCVERRDRRSLGWSVAKHPKGCDAWNRNACTLGLRATQIRTDPTTQGTDKTHEVCYTKNTNCPCGGSRLTSGHTQSVRRLRRLWDCAATVGDETHAWHRPRFFNNKVFTKTMDLSSNETNNTDLKFSKYSPDS